MRKEYLIFTVVMVFMVNTSLAQIDSTECTIKMDTLIHRKLYFLVERESHFPGGSEAMNEFLKENIEYIDPGCYEAKIYVSFVVEENGELTNLYILKGVNESIDKSALQVVEKMPKWIPAKCNDNPVPSRQIIAIRFM